MKETVIEQTLSKHLPIVVDTRILYDYLKAIHSPQSIDEFDAMILKNVLPQFSKIFITPQVLAEINGLVNRDFTSGKKNFLEKTKPFLATIFENYVEKNEILADAKYCELGPTDISIIISTRQTNRKAVSNDKQILVALKSQAISLADMRAHYLNYCR